MKVCYTNLCKNLKGRDNMEVMTDFYYVFYIFLIYAFLGWLIEVVYAYIRKGEFVNRGFLNGPFCPIYGVGVVVIHSLIEVLTKAYSLGGPLPIVRVFIIITIVTTLIELVTGVIMYQLFQTRWWDYSHRKLNVGGYICLRFSLIWGLSGTVMFWLIHGKVLHSIQLIPREFGEFFLILLVIYFIIDGTLTIQSLIDFRRILIEIEVVTKEWTFARRKFSESLISNKNVVIDKLKQGVAWVKQGPTSRIKLEVLELGKRRDILLFRLGNSRLYKAFPDMKSYRFQELLNAIKEKKKDR